MATKLHPGPTVGLKNTTPALMNATLTTPSRGTTAWRAAAYPLTPNPNPNLNHGWLQPYVHPGCNPIYGTRLQPCASGLRPFVTRLQLPVPRRVAAKDTGLLSATTWDPPSYGRYSFPHAIWTAEIRFPIRATPGYATNGGG